MSNTIHPYRASRPDLQQRPLPPNDAEEDNLHVDPQRSDLVKAKSQGLAPESPKAPQHGEFRKAQQEVQATTREIEEASETRFENALDGAIEDGSVRVPAAHSASAPAPLEGLSRAEQQMIHRYFPEAPGLELRLYKPDLSTNKVDPGSVGSRVDLRG